MTKHAHRVSNLANEDADLVGSIRSNMEYFLWELKLKTFEFACISICSSGETLE